MGVLPSSSIKQRRRLRKLANSMRLITEVALSTSVRQENPVGKVKMAKTREREKTKGRERVRKAKRHLRPKQKVQEPFSQALVRRSPSIQIPSEQQYCVFASFPKTALVYCFSFWLSQIFSCSLSVTHA